MNKEFLKRVSLLQYELKVPKAQENSFGGYKYRSCEDILEAVKPIAAKHEIIVLLSDSIEMCGNRVYVKATAKLLDIATGETLETSAYAREAETKKKADDAQITGAASSYARKYALNGLLCIDDAKDPDTDAYEKNSCESEKSSEYDNVYPNQIICPICNNKANGIKSKGRIISAEEFVNTYGMCASCAKNENSLRPSATAF